MTKEEYKSIPLEFELREIKYVITRTGRKQKPVDVATTMLDKKREQGVSADDIAELYGFRWNVELDI